MPKINREDMLELTRRMTVKRNCFHRIAGAYLDADGFIDGTFNIHFQKLSSADQEKNLKIAKAIPFSETNEELKLYHFSEEAKRIQVNESKIKREIREDFSPIMKVQTKPLINLQWLFNLLYQSRFN